MTIPEIFEKQVRSILKNVADLRKFVTATDVYFSESTSFLKNMMEKTGVEYNTDIENLRLPFHDEDLGYTFTKLISLLMEYQRSQDFLKQHLAEFDVQTARQLAAVFEKEESSQTRNKVINEVVENLESLVEEKQVMIEQTREIEVNIKRLETRLSAYFN